MHQKLLKIERKPSLFQSDFSKIWDIADQIANLTSTEQAAIELGTADINGAADIIANNLEKLE
jgi:hypothetical protein